jgi:hypothetical protein
MKKGNREVFFLLRTRRECGSGEGCRMVQNVGKPERSESSGEQVVPTRTNPSGRKKVGHSFLGGIKPLERRYKVRKGFVGKRRNGRLNSKEFFRSRRRKKALKGEPQECWELKEIPKGFRG